MIIELSVVNRHPYYGNGYIAGTGDGIVTVAGQPAQRPVYLLVFPSAGYPPTLVTKVFSNKEGRYLFKNIDPSLQYLIMVRDLPPQGTEQRYEPFCYDYVTPATDLTVAEQQAMWESWQV